MNKDTLKLIIDIGGEMQKIVAIEELSELQKEICKDLRGKLNKVGLEEEVADSMIMINQLILIYGLDLDHLNKIVDLKLQRTLERISYGKDL